MTSSIDPEFLKFIKFMPDKYLQTIEDLKLKTLECERLKAAKSDSEQKYKSLKEEFQEWKRRSTEDRQYYEGKIKMLTEENEQLRKRERERNATMAVAIPSSRYHYSNPRQPEHRRGDYAATRYNAGGYQHCKDNYGLQVNAERQLKSAYSSSRGNRTHHGSKSWTASTALTVRDNAAGSQRCEKSPSPPHLQPFYMSPVPSPPPSALLMLTDGRKSEGNENPEYPTEPKRLCIPKIKTEPMDYSDTEAEYQPENNTALTTVKKEALDDSSFSGFGANYMIRYGSGKLTLQNERFFPKRHPFEMAVPPNFGVDNDLPDDADISCRQRLNSICFTSQRQQDLMEALKQNDKNSPFESQDSLTNHHLIIVINESPKANRIRFCQNLQKYLEIRGKQFYFFTFSSEMDTPVAVWYQRVREFLRVMPNLKMMKLKICLSSYNRLCSNEELNDLQDACERIYPFPVFKQLVEVHFENVPYSIMEAVLKKNDETIEKLQVVRTDEMGIWKDFGSIYEENLTDFSITFYKLEEMLQLQHVNWPLKNLTIRLQFEMKISTKPNDFEKFFRTLERFSETLTSLKITFFQVPHYLSRLRLPKLKRLDVYFAEDASLNFILGLKALTELKVHLCKERKDMSDDLIKFNGYINCMTKSNIWERVPSLEQLEMTTHYDGVAKTYFDKKP